MSKREKSVNDQSFCYNKITQTDDGSLSFYSKEVQRVVKSFWGCNYNKQFIKGEIYVKQ